MESRKTEWRLDAFDLRAVERWLAAPERHLLPSPPKVVPDRTSLHVDAYLDTDDWRFRRAGYALRVRRVGRRRRVEASLENLSSEPALRRPGEISDELELADPGELALAAGPLGDRVRAVAGRKPLLRLFDVRTRRRVFTLLVDGLPPGELALDDTTLRAATGGEPTRLRRVALTVPDALQSHLRPFVESLRDDCALRSAHLTTYEAGLLAADLRPSGPERFGAIEITGDATIGEIAVAVLRRHFSALLEREPGTRLGEDIEELHDMRVAARRLRAALSLFRDVLPSELLQVDEELRWLGGTLGAVRDLDVQLELHHAWLTDMPEVDREPLEGLGRLLSRQRDEARTALLEALDSARYASFVSRFGRLLRSRRLQRPEPAATAARAAAPDLIERRLRRVRTLGDRISPGSPATDYHRLRIHCKRLRYALEFLGDLYPGESRPLLRRLAALQDVLGLHQDADVAIERLRRLAGERSDELGAATIFAMGEVSERYRREMVDLRARFPGVYAQATGKRWKAYKAMLERRRPTPQEAESDGGGTAAA